MWRRGENGGMDLIKNVCMFEIVNHGEGRGREVRGGKSGTAHTEDHLRGLMGIYHCRSLLTHI